jgi:hypothetical protein
MPEQTEGEEPVKKTTITVTREEELEGAYHSGWITATLTLRYSNSCTVRHGTFDSHLQLGTGAHRGKIPTELFLTKN